MDPGSPLRAELDAMGADGSNMGLALEAEVNSIRFAPLDDNIAEGLGGGV